MSKEVNKHEQLTFDFDKEYPSLLTSNSLTKEIGHSDSRNSLVVRLKSICCSFSPRSIR